MRPDPPSIQTVDAIAGIFRDPAAVWTIDEVAGRFGISIGQAIRAMSDLEAIEVVRRLGDEFVPGSSAATPA